MALVPTGPLALSPDFDDLIETSTSLGEAVTEGDTLTLHSLSRSSNDAALPDVIDGLDAIARLTGGMLEVKHNYGGWRPNLDSPALAVARRVYENLFGEPPIVTAVHAGLETAVIGDKVEGLDMRPPVGGANRVEPPRRQGTDQAAADLGRRGVRLARAAAHRPCPLGGRRPRRDRQGEGARF